jgi:hypothetical protein
MTAHLIKEDVIAALHANKGMVTLTADMLQCNPQTIYNWIKKSPDVRAVIDAEREKVIDVAEIALMGAIQRKEGWAIAFALKTIGKRRGYVERTEQVNFNVDADLLKRAIDAIEAQGLNASDVFEQIIQQASTADRARIGADGIGESSSAGK